MACILVRMRLSCANGKSAGTEWGVAMVARNFSQYPSYGVAPPAALLGAERGRSLGRTVMAIAIGALAFDLALIRPCNENGVPAVNLAAATMVAAGGGWSSQAHAAAPAVGVWDPGEFFGKHIQPEKVIPITRKLSVKPNWDNEVDIML